MHEHNRKYRQHWNKKLPIFDSTCIHKGEEIRREECASCQGKTQIKVFECKIHNECVNSRKIKNIQSCSNCQQYTCMQCRDDGSGKCQNCLQPFDYTKTKSVKRNCEPSEKKSKMALLVKDGNPLFLGNLFQGVSCFYIGCGPSLLKQNEQLNILQRKRYLITFAVNNIAASFFKPDLWCCVDDPKSFHKVIWEDPTIMKFVPSDKLHLAYKDADKLVRQCPNVIGYHTKDPLKFEADKFLSEDTVCWGCDKTIPDDAGEKAGRSVMFAALKLMYYLGFKNVYLLGCDFNMQHDIMGEGTGKTYAFHQYKHERGCKSNNNCYRIMDKRL